MGKKNLSISNSSRHPAKSFITKTFLLSFLIYGSWFAYVEFFSMNLFNEEYPAWRYQNEFASRKIKGPEPQILIFGDSRTMAGVDPKMISDQARSLCLTGSSSVESYFLLRRYLRHHAPPKFIFCSLAPRHLIKMECFWRNVEFNFFSIQEVLEIYKKDEAFGGKNFGAGFEKYLKLTGTMAHFPYFNQAALQESLLSQRWQKNFAVYSEIQQHRGFYNFSTLHSSNHINKEAEELRPFIPSSFLSFYLEAFFQLCRDHDIQLIYETLPMNPKSKEVLSQTLFLKEYDLYVKHLQQEFPEFMIQAGWPVYPPEDFGDSSHLNLLGTAEFSRHLKETYFSAMKQNAPRRRVS